MPTYGKLKTAACCMPQKTDHIACKHCQRICQNLAAFCRQAHSSAAPGMATTALSPTKRKVLAPLTTNADNGIETQRDARMAANAARMAQLGLEVFGAEVAAARKRPCHKTKPKEAKQTQLPERRSAREYQFHLSLCACSGCLCTNMTAYLMLDQLRRETGTHRQVRQYCSGGLSQANLSQAAL